MSALRIVFAGTPEFACPALERLIADGRRPLAVLTQPDRPAGRGQRLKPPPVKRLALEHGLEVFQPETLRDPESRAALAGFAPDLFITAAYGLLLPREVLELPARGCWNLHASLLPRWRGASPIQQAILAGDPETGVSLMQMDEGLDTGPVFFARATPIGAEETAGELHDRLARLAAAVLAEGLERLEAGRLGAPEPQDDARATHAPLIRKGDARLDFALPAAELARRVRAYNPWPVAFGEVRGERLRIFRARPEAGPAGDRPPGEPVRGRGRDALRIACGEGILAVSELQSPGGRRLAASDWLNARPDWC